MFANIPVGKARNPLNRPQLKWLLVALGVVVVIAIVFLFSESMKKAVSVPEQTISGNGDDRMKPAQDEIRKRLEDLAAADAANLVSKPSQDEIRKRLETLAKE